MEKVPVYRCTSKGCPFVQNLENWSVHSISISKKAKWKALGRTQTTDTIIYVSCDWKSHCSKVRHAYMNMYNHTTMLSCSGEGYLLTKEEKLSITCIYLFMTNESQNFWNPREIIIEARNVRSAETVNSPRALQLLLRDLNIINNNYYSKHQHTRKTCHNIHP